jgi:lipopolysaccharide transport system permease protein
MKDYHDIITPKSGGWRNLLELIRYKDLLYILAFRDYRVRYAQTFLGFSWAFIQPALTITILVLVFGKLGGIKTELPYPLVASCGLVVWSYFSYVMAQSGNSIIASQQMVKKIYFPKIIIPISKSLVGLIDFCISFLILIALMVFYKVPPKPQFFFFPIFCLLGIVAALGVGSWLSALTVKYRDFQHVVPFMVQIGLYATPVAYPAALVTQKMPTWLESLYYLNPMVGVIEGFRWSVLGIGELQAVNYVSFLFAIVLLITGMLYFNKIEKDMADLV